MGKQLSLWSIIFSEGVKPLLQAIVIFPIMVLMITILFGIPWTYSDWVEDRGKSGSLLQWTNHYEDRTTTITNRKYTAVDQGYCPKWNKVVDADSYVEYVFKFMWSNDYRIVRVC